MHPEDMEPVLRIHVKLRRRLERYAKLKTEIEKSLVDMQARTRASHEPAKPPDWPAPRIHSCCVALCPGRRFGQQRA